MEPDEVKNNIKKMRSTGVETSPLLAAGNCVEDPVSSRKTLYLTLLCTPDDIANINLLLNKGDG